MRILAVGERFNQKEWKPSNRKLDKSFELRRRMGVYNRGPRRKFLDDLGIRWHDGVNLLWPYPVPGEWEAYEAKSVVRAISPHVVKYDVVLLFGKRVCDAFSVPFKVGERFTWTFKNQSVIAVPLPHPSGRSRLWNKRETRDIVRRIAEAYR